MVIGLVARVAAIQIDHKRLATAKTTDRVQFEGLPKEIISQILRYSIPTWSLRIDRRTRHACRPGGLSKDSTADTHTLSTLTYTAKPTSPHDIRRLLRINKYIASLVRAEYVHTFSGILEVYRFVIQGEGSNTYQRMESITTRDGCSCFTSDDRVDRLRRALGIYAKHVSAIRLMDSDIKNFDEDLLELLPMAEIAFIDDRPLLRNLSFSRSDIAKTRLIDVPRVDIEEQVSHRWATEYAKIGYSSGATTLSRDILFTSGHLQEPSNILLECRVTLASRGPKRFLPYFLVGVMVRRVQENRPEVHVLNRYAQEDEDLIGGDVRLASYLIAFKELEGLHGHAVS